MIRVSFVLDKSIAAVRMLELLLMLGSLYDPPSFEAPLRFTLVFVRFLQSLQPEEPAKE